MRDHIHSGLPHPVSGAARINLQWLKGIGPAVGVDCRPVLHLIKVVEVRVA